jgi:uncharacterized protein YjbI with pentapeptide repeats
VSQPASDRSSGEEPDQTGPAPEQQADDRVVAIRRATLRGVDFRKARFDKFTLGGCLFVSCDFRMIAFDRRYQPLLAAVPASIFRDCRFDGADLRRTKPGQTRFERCTFDDAAIDGWRTETAEFIGCRFAGALGTVVFYGKPSGPLAHLVQPVRKRNEFTGNDFRDADLDHVTFTGGIDLSTQRLPHDERYVWLDRFPQRMARARTQIGRWDVQEERLAALEMLRELSVTFRDQPNVFASRVSATGQAARVQTRVWTELERTIA